METQTRLSRHNKFISAENIVGKKTGLISILKHFPFLCKNRQENLPFLYVQSTLFDQLALMHFIKDFLKFSNDNILLRKIWNIKTQHNF